MSRKCFRGNLQGKERQNWGGFSNVALNHVDNGISIAAACESSGPAVTGLAVRWGFDTRQGGGLAQAGLTARCK